MSVATVRRSLWEVTCSYPALSKGTSQDPLAVLLGSRNLRVIEGKTTFHRFGSATASRSRSIATVHAGSSTTLHPALDFGFALSTAP